MREITVKIKSPMRLDQYLAQEIPAFKTSLLHKAFRQNKIKVNGKRRPLSAKIQDGDVIRIYVNEMFPPFYPTAELIYEDENIMIVNKPAGIPVESRCPYEDTLEKRVRLTMAGENHSTNLSAFLRPCHRIDTGTTGLVLFAKNVEAEQYITSAIKNHELIKTYLCITVGHPIPDKATLTAYLVKDSAQGKVFISKKASGGSKKVITSYETVMENGRFSLLNVSLITGRTHQIRAHLASIGCPVLGDGKYGDFRVNKELRFKYQALCAWKISFPKDISNKRFAYLAGRTFSAPKPWYYWQMLERKLY